LSVASGKSGFNWPRSGTVCDQALTRVEFRRAGDDAAVAQWLILSAHPTVAPRKASALDGDFPQRLSAAEELAHGVTLVLQGAGGNATVSETTSTPESVADAFEKELRALQPQAVEDPIDAAWGRASVSLPRPDSSRLVPALSRAAADNFFCGSAPRAAEVAALRLGPVQLLAMPGELTGAAGVQLAQASGAARVLSLVNDDLGYVESAELVTKGEGESKRQFFGAVLLARLAQAASLAGEAAGMKAR